MKWIILFASAAFLGTAPAQQSVASFTLIDAETDLPIAAHDPIMEGATIDTSVTGSALNIRANTEPATVGSVVFALTGATSQGQTESAAPYALYGDSSGDYNPGSFSNGAHALTATPYTAAAGGGTAGTPLIVNFIISAGPPPAFSVDAGPDFSLRLPTDSTVLRGSAADGEIQTMSWTQVSGPMAATLSGETGLELTASDLVVGIYTFEFSATAVGGGSDSDQVMVTVLPVEASTVAVSGELKKWHRVTLHCPGPATNELAEPNPFADYRLDATFTHPDTGKSYVVPGFYAADGEAAETSADAGNQWQVRFCPDEEGIWNYLLSFRTGDDVAVEVSAGAGSPAGFFDGESGTIEVGPTDKAVPDLRAKGRLEYVEAHHLRFAETKEWFMKCGTDAPENLLAYDDFDDTPDVGNRRKSWAPHAGDYVAATMGEFTWQGGKGNALLGAVDYLASEGLNAFSFLTFNIDGDDDNVFPHRLVSDVAAYEAVSDNQRWDGGVVHQDRFDVSKLDQWERLMAFSGTRGMFLHFKTQETENDQRMDGGALGRERILYYRELVARFGHHLALNWNIGEENTNTPAQRIEIAQWFHDHDPYRHPAVIHTYPGEKEAVYTPLLGSASKYAGTSLQTNSADFRNVFADSRTWVENSAAAGKKWVVACDEPGDAQHALRPDNDAGNSHVDGRKNALWGHALAGGAGLEWYFGYGHAHSDLTCEDFRSRDQFWDVCRYFLEFWETSGAPFWAMSNANALVSGSGDNANRCLASPGSHYVLQLYNGDGGGATSLDLTNAAGEFQVRWFDPRNGGDLQEGSVATVSGGGVVMLGSAPDSPNEDWIVHLSPVPGPCRVLFLRGADRSGGFLEAGNDAQRTEQLADIFNPSTSGGNHGWNSFRTTLEAAGSVVHQITETAENGSGPSQGRALDLQTFDLDSWDLVVFGSNNAVYATASVDALEDWVRERGGSAMFISDANFGGSWPDAPDSDQPFLERFGLVVNQDQGTYSLIRGEGDFAAPAHPVLSGVDRFDGEGVSPFVLNRLPVPTGTTITKLANAKGNTRNNDGNPGSSRATTADDASLVAVEAGYGRVVGHFDRNTFFNLNGAGTNITRFDNEQLALNLIGWLTQKVDPLSPFAGWQQTYFADLPGGRNDAGADFAFDADGDLLSNGMEYVLGSHPRLPSRGLEVDEAEVSFFVAAPFPDDARLVIQASMDLKVWTDVASRLPGQAWTGPVTAVPAGGRTRVSLPLPADAGRSFYRLFASMP